MSRDERIAKLGNAIRTYRGRYDEKTGKWYAAPQPDRIKNIIHWLESLNLDVEGSVSAIKGFKHFKEFRSWISEIK